MPAVFYSGPFVVEVNPLPLFAPTGDVTRYFEERLVSIKRRAKTLAPHGGSTGRTQKSRYNPEPFGYLKASIQGEASRVGPLQISLEIRAEARYAKYVIKGTPPIIRAKSTRVAAGEVRRLPGGGIAKGGTFAPGQRGMYLPPAPALGYKGGVKTQQVKGQKANDFLSAAVNAEAVLHPALLGYDKA